MPLNAVDPARLHESMVRRLQRRLTATGEIQLPAVPGMLDDYVRMCDVLFAALGRKFTADELASLRTIIEGQLAEAYAATHRSNIVITYNIAIEGVVNYHVRAQWSSVEATYEEWLSNREPPLFGTEPDARVWAMANEALDPKSCHVLDIGAGTGRNALALARRGHPVDAVEMTPKFAEMIRADAQRESLNVRVIERDVFESAAELRPEYDLILLSEVVSDFRTTQQLRQLFELADQRLARNGRLMFNAFLPRDGFLPDDGVRGLGQQMYTSIFTWDEMAAAAEGLALELVTDDSVYEYEQAHLPTGAWPPTSWYARWVSGQDVFDIERENCPIEMRWLVYWKTGWAPGRHRAD